VYRLNITAQTATLVTQNKPLMTWPDTLGFDHKGNLVLVTNHLYKFVQGTQIKATQGKSPPCGR